GCAVTASQGCAVTASQGCVGSTLRDSIVPNLADKADYGHTLSARLVGNDVGCSLRARTDKDNLAAWEFAFATQHADGGFFDLDNQPFGSRIASQIADCVIALAVEPTMQSMAAFAVVSPVRRSRYASNTGPDETASAGHFRCASA
ncbi:hypothetical protein, partial [uncultured Rhodoferax sp.]|uniref:hypothetical protein n=1 Tax=uncultured Rhodoferax sp. TaxID=223188 RepID=UPI0025EB7FC1